MVEKLVVYWWFCFEQKKRRERTFLRFYMHHSRMYCPMCDIMLNVKDFICLMLRVYFNILTYLFGDVSAIWICLNVPSTSSGLRVCRLSFHFLGYLVEG